MEGRGLHCFECGNAGLVSLEELFISRKRKFRLLDARIEAAIENVVAQLGEFFRSKPIEAELSEESQRPRRSLKERWCNAMRVPHLHRAAHELIAAGAFH